VVAGVGVALVIVGAFMPWVKLSFISASGTDGDGVLTLIIAAVAGGLIFLGLSRGVAIQATIIGAGALICILAVYNMVDISGQDSEVGLEGLFSENVSIGEGLYMTLVGGIAIVAGGVMGFRARMGGPSPAPAAAPTDREPPAPPGA
jgi:hypothetical protein